MLRIGDHVYRNVHPPKAQLSGMTTVRFRPSGSRGRPASGKPGQQRKYVWVGQSKWGRAEVARIVEHLLRFSLLSL